MDSIKSFSCEILFLFYLERADHAALPLKEPTCFNDDVTWDCYSIPSTLGYLDHYFITKTVYKELIYLIMHALSPKITNNYPSLFSYT